MTKSRIAIGVSRLSDNYANWLNKLHNGLEIIDFYSIDVGELASRFESVSGLLLSGGGDIDPGMYDREGDLVYCKGIDKWRDKLELSLIELAFMFNIPVLGICRGLQMINVARKGSLHPDIPAFVEGSLVHQDSAGDVYHAVRVDQDSLLYKLTRANDATVNSSHHQAIHRLGEGLRGTAFSTDGIIEAIEFEQSRDHSFLVAVQWHPERMDFDNPLSGLLGRGFIEAAAGRKQAP
ncbi:MAG: gamma-glutamyl-gamma-aminobutyrate hydrolase family protein [Bacteroidales bacterium]|nr:gamma-glutamyl-gamma-aminobutyrate hydrolase family protein [Bacteroidales bacterium]